MLLPALTALFAVAFFVALIDQWRERRRPYQLIWSLGMLFFAIAAACEAFAAAGGWNEPLYRVWYLTGAVWTAGWLGLGTAFLLARTRFGYAVTLSLFLAGLFTFLAARRPEYAGAGAIPLLYFVAAAGLAVAVAVETYFGSERWTRFAAAAVVGATLVSVGLMATATLPAPGYALDPNTGVPVGTILPVSLRLLTPFMNITGTFTLVLGALFSAYMFMPKRRVLSYSLDAGQPGDQFLFNLVIAPVAITVNFFASLPGALRELVAGRLHTRVPATLLIAIGAIVVGSADTLNRFGSTGPYQLAKLFGIVLLFAGFLVSIETFREIRVPFTRRVLRGARQESTDLAEHRRGAST